jgi:hypothetical protein
MKPGLIWFQCAALALFLILIPTAAMADCYYNGKRYSEGSHVGAFVCEKGRWVRN